MTLRAKYIHIASMMLVILKILLFSKYKMIQCTVTWHYPPSRYLPRSKKQAYA